MDIRLITHLILLSIAFDWMFASDDVELLFDGTQYIKKSLIVQPTHQQTNELSILFKTAISSGLLFYASGVTGDFIVLELVHGKIR